MVSYDDFVKSWTTDPFGGGGAGQRAQDEGWGLADPLQEIRRRYGVGQNVSDQQLMSWVQENGLPDPQVDKAQFGGALGDAIHGAASLADETKPVWLSAAGGAIGAGLGAGASAAGEGAGTVAGNAGEGASYAANGNAVYDTSSALGGGGGGFGGGGSNPMMPPAQPVEGPMGGYSTDPNTGDVYFGSGDNPYASNFTGGGTNDYFTGGESAAGQVPPDMLQRAKDMAAKLGITPAVALKQLLGAATRAAPAALGIIGANQQAGSLQALADKYMALGAPSRDRYEASFAPGFTMANDPGYTDALNMASKANLHGLSVQGNPALSPNAQAQNESDLYAKTAFPALQNYRATNSNAGGISTLTGAAPGASTGAITAQGNVFNAAGAGLNDIFNPQPSLAQTLAQYQQLMKMQTGAVQ